MKTIWKILAYTLLTVVVIVGGFIGILTLTEYRPDDVEELIIPAYDRVAKVPDQVTITTWNIGYAGLDKTADFFMDGGTGVNPASRELVEENLRAITDFLAHEEIVFVQEVDRSSSRTYSLNEVEALNQAVGQGIFAANYKALYIPYPWPPMGRMHAGIWTHVPYETTEAKRYALPSPFTWPERLGNLKRCLLLTRHPLENGKDLVLVNLHLEAYDDTGGREAQFALLKRLIETEYAKGNFVIAGGDFNSSFLEPNTLPFRAESDDWMPGNLSELERGDLRLITDPAKKPTCRLLNQPYDPESENTVRFIIDGFLVSPNVKVEKIETVDLGFEHSDHNPVRLTVNLK